MDLTMKKSEQLKNNRSKKHHYLPRKYLRGFVNDQSCFFVYDKQNDKILPQPMSPDATFFENNLNTVIFPDGKASDFLEKLYTEFENQSWGPLDTIRKSNNKTPIQLLDKMNIFLFLLFLHWRLPSNIKYVDELSEKFFGKDNDLNYFTLKNKNGESVPQEIAEKIKKSSAFKKSSKLMLPFAPFYTNNWSERLNKDWRFLYTGDGNNWYLVGDNPIITKGDNDHDPINCLNEFVFPISGKILLISKRINKDLSPEFVIQYNISIIERAQRFVACPNKDFLEALIKNYKVYVQFGKTNSIIPEMFDMMNA